MAHDRQNLVPKTHIEEILRHRDWVEKLAMGLPQGDDRTRYFFEIYNTYLATGNREEVETCISCRGKVLMHIQKFYEND